MVGAWRGALLDRLGVSRADTYPACARFKLGDSRLGEVRCGAASPAEIAGGRGEFTALALGADVPTLLREGALQVFAGKYDFA